MNKLILIRGIPGSGKSTKAKKILDEYHGEYKHLEADMFHINKSGEYEWLAQNILASHEWCQNKCRMYLNNGDNVVVSNTFTTLKELRPYLVMWSNIEIIDCDGQYQNIHNVPIEAIKRMSNRWISKDDPEFIEYVNKWKKL